MNPAPACAARARRASRWLLPLLLILLALRLVLMDALPLMDSTEARYAGIARRMAESGDWITPWHAAGVPFWAKPPLSFWLTALSFELFGVSEFAARLPHALCCIATAALVADLARRALGRDAARRSLALLGGSSMFVVAAGAVMTDAALMLAITWAMHSFWCAMHATEAHAATARRARWLFFVALAMGLLAKGPLAVVLVMAQVLAWLAVTRRWRAARERLPWLRGAALTLLLAAPWYAAAELRTPGFLDYFLVGEHWHRFVTPGWSGDRYGRAHRMPPGTIWLFALAACLPWTVLLPLGWRATRADRAAATAIGRPPRGWIAFVSVWALVPLLFFTPARNIIAPYVLPAMPGLALAGATLLARRGARIDRWLTGGLVLCLLAAATARVADRAGWTASHSARDVVRAQHAAAHDGAPSCSGPLHFVGTQPFSAGFYSAGQALEAASLQALRTMLPAQGAAVALSPSEVDAAAAQGLRIERDLGRHGAWMLLCLRRTGPAPTGP